MNKYDLVSAVAEKVGLTKNDVNKTLDALQSVIIEECISKGGEVNLPQLGKFKQKINPARKGINPLTKKPMDVPENYTLRFKPSSTLKKVVVAAERGCQEE